MLKALSVLKARSVFHRFVLLVVLTVGIVSLIACAAPAATTPVAATPEAAGAPTRNPRTPLPLPAQPTSPAIATKAVAPVASATVPSIVSGVPVTPGAVAATSLPTVAVVAATATRPPATATAVVAATTAPGGAAGRAEIKVDFVIKLPSAEDVDDLREPLVKDTPGILAISGDDNSITIVYDPARITVAQIKARLSVIGHPVK